MGSVFFTMDDRNFDVLEMSLAQHLAQFDLRESKPDVGVQFSGFLKADEKADAKK